LLSVRVLGWFEGISEGFRGVWFGLRKFVVKTGGYILGRRIFVVSTGVYGDLGLEIVFLTEGMK